MPSVRQCFVLRASLATALVFAAGSLAAPTALAQKILAPGFSVELLAEAPEIEHPSVVTCDDAGNLFVGEDPMDMRGPSRTEFDRVLLLRWDRQTGKATKTVFCEGLSAVFGLVWHEGALYVLHAPHYTMFRDTNGDGVADERKELADGFGPPAGVFGFNDHIVTGTRLGLDGLIYVSVGDKGIPRATGSDGSVISLEGGGVARMRPDGSQLEIVSSGTRNHLDVAMDSLDNIFTYDNTDDGLGWWTRFTHHIPTGYYGYPYDYHPHPERHLPRVSEHGGGSPVGAACYCEAAWPEQYRDNAFHCEWGKGKIQRFTTSPSGATFKATIDDFMVKEGAEEFRPLDVCFSPDGKHMYVADWNFGGWVKPAVKGRLYRVTYTGGDVPPEPARAADADALAAQLRSLGHPARSERTRAQWALARLGAPAVGGVAATLAGGSKMAKVHALWTQNLWIDRIPGYDPAAAWILALGDSDADVRSQAARAIGLRRMQAGLPALIAALADPAPAVRMWAAIGLGRLKDPAAAEPLFRALSEQDVFARFAIVQALRAINHWTAADAALASPSPDVRAAAVLTLTGVYDDAAVAALAKAIKQSPDEATRAAAVTAIGAAHHKAEPYSSGWWGTRPAAGKPKRPKNLDWSGAATVMTALGDAIQSPDDKIRAAALEAFNDIRDPAVEALFIDLATNPTTPEPVRVGAIQWLSGVDKLSDASKEAIVRLMSDSAQPLGITLAALGAVAERKIGVSTSMQDVERLVGDARAPLRAQALEALARLKDAAAGERIEQALADSDLAVRLSAVRRLGEIKYRPAVPKLLNLMNDPALGDAALAALLSTPDARALGVYLDAVQSKNLPTREAARAAITLLRDTVGDDLLERHRKHELPGPARLELQAIFNAPQPVMEWKMAGPWAKELSAPSVSAEGMPDFSQPLVVGGKSFPWRDVKTKDQLGRVALRGHYRPDSDAWVLAYASIVSDEDSKTGFLAGSDDQMTLWVNGEKLHEFKGNRGWSADSARGELRLRKGVNHVWMLVGNDSGPWDFSFAVVAKNPKYAFLNENTPARLDTGVYRDFATKHRGDPARGRALFVDLKGIGCVKCHAVGGEGGKIGPDLVGVGVKYPREELIRSVLEPSNRVLDGYRVTTIVTDSGKSLQGIVRGEGPAGVELLDAEGRTVRVPKDDIEERVESNLSLMPNGLKDGMTLENFADVIAYMESLKEGKK